MSSVLSAFAQGTRRGPFTVPPGPMVVDWTHPLSRGLLCCFVPGVTRGINLADRLIDFTIAGGATDLMTADGPALSASAPLTQVDPVSTWTSGEVTYYSCGYITGTPGANAQILTTLYNNASGAPFLITGLGFSITTSEYNFWWAQGTTLQDLKTVGPSIGTPAVGRFSFGATMTQSGTPTVKGYLNGLLTITNTINVGVQSGATFSEVALNAVSNVSATAAYMWNRALTDDEMMWVNLDPFAMLIPQEPDIPMEMLPPVFVLMPQACL